MKDNQHQFLKDMDLDHRGLYQETCLAINNPMNNFIFDQEDPTQELFIQGKILNLINYEVKCKLGNVSQFIEGVKDIN